MKIEPIAILKTDDRGVIYRIESINYIVRKKGTISADHTHPEEETLYLIEGEVKLTIGEETKNIVSPIKVSIPSGIYHKLLALTDIKLLEFK